MCKDARNTQYKTDVLHSSNDIVTNGVIIATELEDQYEVLTLTTTGEYWKHKATDVMFSVPDFVDASMVERCGRTVFHASDGELAARLKVLNRARNFERAVETEEHKIAKAVKELDEFLANRFSAGDIDGLSVAVVSSIGPLYEKNWGVQRGNESATSPPMTSRSAHRIASVVKIFPVLEGIILEQRGVISW